MDFTSAFVSMQQGHKVTRTTWKGYWCILNGEIIMVTKDGKAVNLRESPDMMYTISNMLCADCLSKMPFIRKPSCRMCGGELDGFLDICSECCRKSSLRPWTEARAVFRMEGELQEMIHAFKYQNHPELARTFGYFACDAVSGILNSVDVIVPIPLHWTRQWKRGYNQQSLIAEQIANASGVPCENLLKRVRMTGQQIQRGQIERIKNLNHAFFLKNSTNIENRAILLVDDVMTTGATLASASKILLDAGAGKVFVLVIARRQRN